MDLNVALLKLKTRPVLRTGFILLAALILLSSNSVASLQLTSRSLRLADVSASSVTEHSFAFSFPSTNSVGSLKFEYCTSPLPQVPCSAPTGLDTSSASLTGQSGETGFLVFSQSTNAIILGRVASVTSTSPNSYTFAGVTNPSSIGQFFVRISSFASSDGSGAELDEGSVVGTIAIAVSISTEVPPILNFCSGASISGSCASTSGSFLQLGNLSTSAAKWGTSQFIVGTNASFGYAVTVNGTTMTSGNNIISAMATPAASNAGTSQFGINLRANSSPAVGADPAGGSGTLVSGYDTPNQFKFGNGNLVASSSGTTEERKFTVSYLVNVSNLQPIGVYNTTLTYICTATF